MNTKTIATINAIDIVCFTETDKQLVPIKPILEAINQDYISEASHMFADPFWVSIIRATSPDEADIEKYGLIALPLDYIPGWLFTLQRDPRFQTSISFRRIQMQMYDAFMYYIKNYK